MVVGRVRRMCQRSSRAAATASGGTGALFSEARSGMVPPGSAPIRASGRENSTPISCISGAAPAAAVLGRRRASRLASGPRASLRACLILQLGRPYF